MKVIDPRQALGVNLIPLHPDGTFKGKLIAKLCFLARRLVRFAEFTLRGGDGLKTERIE